MSLRALAKAKDKLDPPVEKIAPLSGSPEPAEARLTKKTPFCAHLKGEGGVKLHKNRKEVNMDEPNKTEKTVIEFD